MLGNWPSVLEETCERHMHTMRADVIGSLLRPPYLLDAKRGFEEGRIQRDELEGAEDRAVDELIALQEHVGLEVVTDGERHVPEDKHVVLGLVGTKNLETPTVKNLLDRLDEAARIVPRERLAISPQCGFSTSIVGNRITPDDQRRKLERVVAVAREFWPAG